MTYQPVSILTFLNLLLSPNLYPRVRSNQTPNLYWAKTTASRASWPRKKLRRLRHSPRQPSQHSRSQEISELASSSADARTRNSSRNSIALVLFNFEMGESFLIVGDGVFGLSTSYHLRRQERQFRICAKAEAHAPSQDIAKISRTELSRNGSYERSASSTRGLDDGQLLQGILHESRSCRCVRLRELCYAEKDQRESSKM